MKHIRTQIHHAEYEIGYDWQVSLDIVLRPTFTMTAFFYDDEADTELEVTFQNGTYAAIPYQKPYLHPEAQNFPISFVDDEIEVVRSKLEVIAADELKKFFKNELYGLENINLIFENEEKITVMGNCPTDISIEKLRLLLEIEAQRRTKNEN